MKLGGVVLRERGYGESIGTRVPLHPRTSERDMHVGSSAVSFSGGEFEVLRERTGSERAYAPLLFRGVFSI